MPVSIASLSSVSRLLSRELRSKSEELWLGAVIIQLTKGLGMEGSGLPAHSVALAI